ncbi:MAG TPA: hypothetical protein VGR35_08255 [Tepidisphaeraceae bacterium]|nr:hypothetical protein [Tepidisphaeraceae bacterium]
MSSKKKSPDMSGPGVLGRLRHPSPRGKLFAFAAVSVLSALYLTGSTIWNGRDLLPKSHDEHSYAIQTQMIARGKLWMPQHELADFFESFQMLARPVYASIYFPGSALMYAPGVWLSLPPWVMPVLVSGLSAGLSYLLATRLIDGLAGLLVALLLLASHWFRMNATLVMSQSPMMVLGLGILLASLRWREGKDVKWAALIGACAGWAAIVRPVDALAFAIPIGVAMLLDFRRLPLRRVAITCAIVIVAAVPFLSLQLALNKGTTGSFTRAPHTLYLQTDQPNTTYGFHAYDPHARPQSKLLQKQIYYRNFMLPDVQKHRPDRIVHSALERLMLTVDVALSTKLLLVLVIAGLFNLTDAPRRVIAAVPLVFFLLYLPYTFYMEHYVLPIVPPILLLVVLGAQRIAAMWKEPAAKRKAERVMVAVLVVVALASLPEVNPRVRDDRMFGTTSTIIRSFVRPRVTAPAVVLVRYREDENPHDEPVYNSNVAWPDEAAIILAHDLGPRNMEIIEYFARMEPQRRFYLFDRDKLLQRKDLPLRELGTAGELALRLRAAATQPVP